MSGVIGKAINWMGFGRDADVSYAPAPVSAPAPKIAPASKNVTQLWGSSRMGGRQADISEIATLQPHSYEEAREIADRFRYGVPVIVNMGELSELDSRRLLDFMLGLKSGLDGHLKRVTPKVFLLSPAHVAINDEDEDSLDDSGDNLIVHP